MAVSIVNRTQAVALPAISTPSLSRRTDVRGLVANAAHASSWAIVIGSAASQPAVFTDFVGAQTYHADTAWNTLSASVNPDNTYNISAFCADADFSGWSAGDHLWLGFFDGTASPTGSNPVTAVTSMGILAA